jgi:phosphonate degradation associated HDIG domain protein
MPTVVDQILELFARQGQSAYLGEAVSQTEHALQAAYLAEQQGAPATLIAAALLHDIGHLLDTRSEDPATMTEDLAHETLAERWLQLHFPPAVTRPVALHVPAKRYLCATDPAYLRQLSPTSVASLRLQGGPMTPEEVATFRADPYAEDALRLRRWDEQAKVPQLPTPDLEHFRPVLELAQNRARA